MCVKCYGSMGNPMCGPMAMTEWVRRLAFYGGVIRGILFGAHETHPLNGGACRMGCGWYT